jgi:Zinc finger, C3HC4 type (RING finger)
VSENFPQDKKMLLCFSDSRHITALFDALELTVTSASGSVACYGGEYYAYLFNHTESKKAQIERLRMDRVIIVDPDYPMDDIPEGDYAFLVSNAEELEELMALTFTPQALQKIARRLFDDVVITVAFIVPPKKEEPTRVKRNRTVDCVACESTQSSVMFNCGHEALCEACADTWLAEKKECPMCREAVVKIFL